MENTERAFVGAQILHVCGFTIICAYGYEFRSFIYPFVMIVVYSTLENIILLIIILDVGSHIRCIFMEAGNT